MTEAEAELSLETCCLHAKANACQSVFIASGLGAFALNLFLTTGLGAFAPDLSLLQLVLELCFEYAS